MANWKRQPQEKKGKYRFNGQLYITANIKKELTNEEIALIILDTKRFALEQDGIDYLQVYVDEAGQRKIFFIDQIDDRMKKEHPPEHNYATLLFAWEY